MKTQFEIYLYMPLKMIVSSQLSAHWNFPFITFRKIKRDIDTIYWGGARLRLSRFWLANWLQESIQFQFYFGTKIINQLPLFATYSIFMYTNHTTCFSYTAILRCITNIYDFRWNTSATGCTNPSLFWKFNNLSEGSELRVIRWNLASDDESI
jgi:hypothetical protein